jgi:hypothetical protein
LLQELLVLLHSSWHFTASLMKAPSTKGKSGPHHRKPMQPFLAIKGVITRSNQQQ